MRSRHLLSVLLVLSLSLGASAQTQEPKPQADPLEDAHQGLFQKQPDRAVEAGRTTSAFQQAGPVLSANVPRRNFIDEQLLGRMERDGVPHAGLAGDEEFIRRAYIDATGLLP